MLGGCAMHSDEEFPLENHSQVWHLISLSVEEALELDCESNTDHWAKAIAKENKQVKVSWHAMDGVTPDDVRKTKVKELTGHQEINDKLTIWHLKQNWGDQSLVCDIKQSGW